ncbi:hypothetical protein [Kitasatospora sp. NPDC058190]|uniref:hypothetical protein n=1 Tax=Kitasatospora sp. NPDC058190 TaxID=3346371 RepID=UPI0036DAA43B
MDGEALTALWERRWPGSPPVGHEIDPGERDVWVRFHSLPRSKRHPETERVSSYGWVARTAFSAAAACSRTQKDATRHSSARCTSPAAPR